MTVELIFIMMLLMMCIFLLYVAARYMDKCDDLEKELMILRANKKFSWGKDGAE